MPDDTATDTTTAIDTTAARLQVLDLTEALASLAAELRLVAAADTLAAECRALSRARMAARQLAGQARALEASILKGDAFTTVKKP